MAHNCEQCGAENVRFYPRYFFSEPGAPAEEDRAWLCVKCARAERKAIHAKGLANPQTAYTREDSDERRSFSTEVKSDPF